MAVTVTASAAGFYPNTAVVSDTAPPPDPNTGNNTYVALAPVVSVVCSGAALTTPPAPLSGVQNTYYPGTGTANSGTSSISVGAANIFGAATPIAAGDMLLVIQTQDDDIEPTLEVVRNITAPAAHEDTECPDEPHARAPVARSHHL